MMNLSLPIPLPNGAHWTEEIPKGAVSRGSGTFTADAGSIVLPIWINGRLDNLKPFFQQVIGYSFVDPPFDPNNPAAQGQSAPTKYRLRRVCPARHPHFNNFRATKILSIQGHGLRQTLGQGLFASGNGYYGEYEYLNIFVQFEIPKYEMLTDEQNEKALIADGPKFPRPEYRRFTEWFPEPSIEIIARKGVKWFYKDPIIRALYPGGFAGDRLLRVPKTKLKVVTYDVHVDWVLLGRIIPRSMDNRIGTVNARYFPDDGYRDQNKASGVAFSTAQYGPGTMLMMSPKLSPRTQNHPALLDHPILADYLPRTVDVEQNFIIFNPKTIDRAVIDLSEFGGFDQQSIRGHNLVPLPTPNSRDNLWAVPVNYDPAATPGDPLFLVKPQNLLYQYSDFEALWEAVES